MHGAKSRPAARGNLIAAPAATFERPEPPTCRRRGACSSAGRLGHRHGTGAKDQGVHRRRIRERAASRGPLSWQGGNPGCCCGCPASCCCGSPSGSSWRCCSNCRRVSPGWSLVPPRTTGNKYIAAALRGNEIPASKVPAAQRAFRFQRTALSRQLTEDSRQCRRRHAGARLDCRRVNPPWHSVHGRIAALPNCQLPTPKKLNVSWEYHG